MGKTDSPVPLLVAGAYIKSDAYPNVLHRIRALANHPRIEMEELNCGLLNTTAGKRRRTTQNPLRFFICHISVLLKIIFHRHKPCVYVPYPAVFLQCLLSFLPTGLRPGVTLVDAFISLYDTTVIDRKLLKSENWLAKLLFRVERRAFASADWVIVDTVINSQYYSSLFQLSDKKFIPVSLATNEKTFHATPYTAQQDDSCRVLFIGTLIPLHGIQTIIAAIELLREHQNIVFHIIGDGQEASYIEEFESQISEQNAGQLTWSRNWLSSEALAAEIARSDICLGIFGSTPKTQRVCPYKIYHYACAGRPIITARTDWTDSIGADEDEMPFMLVDANEPAKLARQILMLARSPDMRVSLAGKSRDFYQQRLSVQASTNSLVEVLQQHRNTP